MKIKDNMKLDTRQETASFGEFFRGENVGLNQLSFLWRALKEFQSMGNIDKCLGVYFF